MLDDAAMDRDLRARAANVGRLLARAQKAVAIIVPESWADADGADDVDVSHRARAFLRGLLEIDDLGVAIVGSLPDELAPNQALSGSFDPRWDGAEHGSRSGSRLRSAARVA